MEGLLEADLDMDPQLLWDREAVKLPEPQVLLVPLVLAETDPVGLALLLTLLLTVAEPEKLLLPQELLL